MSHPCVCNLCDLTFPTRGAVAFVKDGFVIVRCPRCSLVFREVMPAVEEVAAIYGTSYFAGGSADIGGTGYGDYLGEEPNHRANARRRLGLLSRYLPPGRLLDVGCAAGFFLDEARRSGWRVAGIDVSPEMSAQARDRLDLDVSTGSFLDQDITGDLDAVTLWDYLEHVVDPKSELTRMAASLRRGGLLALSTGDVSTVVARVSRGSWHLLTPEHHNYFFSKKTLERYLGGVGLEVVYTGYPGNTYSVRYLLHKIRTLGTNGIVRGAAVAAGRTPLAALRVPLNLWDIVTVIARKP